MWTLNISYNNTGGTREPRSSYQTEMEIIESKSLSCIKFFVYGNLFGCGTLQLSLDNLKREQAIIYVQCDKECFKYGLLLILLYSDLPKHSDPNAYKMWLRELKFDDGDPSDVHIQKGN